MNTRKILFLDFDNTLFSHKTNQVPKSAKIALRNLHNEGHIVVLATGRGQESMKMIENETDFFFDAYILLNGQVVMKDGITVFEHYISLQDSSGLFSQADQIETAYGGFCSQGQAVNRINDNVLSVWSDYKAPVPHVISSFRSLERIYLLQLYITENQEPEFHEFLSDYVTNRPHRCMLNLIPGTAGKSLGIGFLLEQFKISRSDAFAFGDGFNDEDMLLAVGTSVAMADGDSRLKKLATFICPPADEDGIADSLKKMGVL